MEMWQLRQRQSLPLSAKVFKSIRTIEKFCSLYDGNVYVSKGGVDSCVLEDLVNRTVYKREVKSICVASVEPKENIKHNFEKGNILIKSPINKIDVIKKYGYPLISKQVAMSISRYKNTKHEWVKEKRLHGYYNKKGVHIRVGMIPAIYREMIYAPFELSERCCDKTKKEPLKKIHKELGLYPMTGEMADDSSSRENNYLKNGCIMIDKKDIKCTPLATWTKKDIMEYIYINNLEIPKNYGKVIFENNEFKFTGKSRTGCDICGFGIMFDKDRYTDMKKNNRGIFNYMMRGGEWTRKDKYRWVKFRPNSMPIWSNLYWIPSKYGFGYKFVLNYFYEVIGDKRKIEI